MKRKIVKQGTATLMVSLPAKWAKEQGLDKGDEVNIEEEGNNLRIGILEKIKKKETTIKLSREIESSVRTSITSAYRLGYDKVTVHFHDKKMLQVIRQIVDANLLGFEIIKESSANCIIENITEPSIDQFDNIFGKVILNIETLFEIAHDFTQGKKQSYEAIEQKIIEFDNFCRRVIAKTKAHQNYQLQWAFHTSLNHGQRELFYALNYLEKNKVSPHVSTLIKNAHEIFNLIKEAYEKNDLIIIESLHEKVKQHHNKEGYALLKKGKDAIAVHHIMNAIRNFYLASSPLTGTLMSLED